MSPEFRVPRIYVDRKDGKAKAPVDWIYELFESFDDAFSAYAREEGFFRGCWDMIRGRKPWMIAYYAVLLGHSYNDFLLRDKSQDDAVIRRQAKVPEFPVNN